MYFILGNFSPFHPLNSAKNKTFKKMKKTPGYIIILHKLTKNHDCICYTVLEIWCVTDVIVLFHFGLLFALLPPNSLKNKNFNKMKSTPGNIIILQKCTKNHDHTSYCSWDMARNICNFYFSFWDIFALLQPKKSKSKSKTDKKIKISTTTKKTSGDIIILHMCTINCH